MAIKKVNFRNQNIALQFFVDNIEHFKHTAIVGLERDKMIELGYDAFALVYKELGIKFLFYTCVNEEKRNVEESDDADDGYDVDAKRWAGTVEVYKGDLLMTSLPPVMSRFVHASWYRRRETRYLPVKKSKSAASKAECKVQTGVASNVLEIINTLSQPISIQNMLHAKNMLATMLHQVGYKEKAQAQVDVTPEWIVSDIGELGVKVNGRTFFYFNGRASEHSQRHNIDGDITYYRRVFNDEFGEVIKPLLYQNRRAPLDYSSVNPRKTAWEAVPFVKPENEESDD